MRQQRQVDKQMPDQVVVAESLLRINDRSGRIDFFIRMKRWFLSHRQALVLSMVRKLS